MKQPIEPIIVTDLFAEMRTELLRVLGGLSDEQWQSPTACEGWSVKDVALHILADEIGYLSRHRDNDGLVLPYDSWDDLVEKINQHNELWVQATRRMSRTLLMTLLELTGQQFAEYITTLDLHEGTHSVAWAGTDAAPMWLQLARELTEYWMHHQHVCEAVNITSLKNRRFLHPVLSAFVFALPHTLRDVDAPDNTTVQFSVTGEAADSWYVIREADGWRLYAFTDIEPDAVITLPDDTAWRLFTKGISTQEAAQYAAITGNQALGKTLLNTVAIIA